MATGINVSKGVLYVVVGPQPGVDASKAQAYSVAGPNPGANVAKANAYSVSGPNPGVDVAKANVYVVAVPSQPGVNVSKANLYVVAQPAAAAAWTTSSSTAFNLAVGTVDQAYADWTTSSIANFGFDNPGPYAFWDTTSDVSFDVQLGFGAAWTTSSLIVLNLLVAGFSLPANWVTRVDVRFRLDGETATEWDCTSGPGSLPGPRYPNVAY